MALVIKSLAVDSPNYDELSDDEDDFVKDPAQYRDQLPQPFRYIDELLYQFLDDVWDVITDKEAKLVAELSKIRPPKYECALQLQECPNSKALVPSGDGRYLFIAFPGGLCVMEPGNRRVLNMLDDDRLDLIDLQCTIISVETYLIYGVDELGTCKMFGCALEKLFPMKVLNDESNSAAKLKVTKCQPSVNGDYLGLVWEDPTSYEAVLEIHHLPRDAWSKEIDDIKPKLIKSDEQPSLPEEELVQDAVPAVEDTDDQPSGRKSTESHSLKSQTAKIKSGKTCTPVNPAHRKVTCHTRVSGGVNGQSTSRRGNRTPKVNSRSRCSSRRFKSGSKKGANVFKFSPAVLVMKQKPPENLTANFNSSPAAALKDVADPKHIMGSGNGHLLTKAYTEIRRESFNTLHQDRFIYKMDSSESEQSPRECNFHFVTAGLAVPYSIEQPGSRERITSVGVWWSGSSQFTYYCLTRPVKPKKQAADNPEAAALRGGRHTRASKLGHTDLGFSGAKTAEVELKPETIWPQGAAITASSTTTDSSLVALGLENGIVTIWDKHLCCVRKSVVVSQSAVVKLDFMDPSICPQSNNNRQCYPTTTSCYVLVRSADSSVHLLNCGQLDYTPPITLAERTDDSNLSITDVQLFPNRCPEIVLMVRRNGCLFLHDVVTNKTLCEVALPSTYKLATPWQPVLSVAAYGQMLYIKGSRLTPEGQVDNSDGSLFVFQLRSFPSLDSYWMKQRPAIDYLAFSPMDIRVNSLLTKRVKSSGARQQRLQQRWPLMKQELNRISQIKSH